MCIWKKQAIKEGKYISQINIELKLQPCSKVAGTVEALRLKVLQMQMFSLGNGGGDTFPVDPYWTAPGSPWLALIKYKHRRRCLRKMFPDSMPVSYETLGLRL